MILSDFLILISEKAYSRPEEFLQPGHNGPYNDPETSVRNYGHWLITFSKCFDLTGEKIYLEQVKKLAECLVEKKSRPLGFSFHHRLKEGKDKCNGLIGQAWTFEALACASSVLDNQEFAQVAEDVFFQHKYNQSFSHGYIGFFAYS